MGFSGCYGESPVGVTLGVEAEVVVFGSGRNYLHTHFTLSSQGGECRNLLAKTTSATLDPFGTTF